MISKIIAIIFYGLVLYNFTFLDIGNIYNYNIDSLDFRLFVINFMISVSGIIFLKFYNFKNINLKNNLKNTFFSVFYLYLFLIVGFFISQEFISQNRIMITVTKLSGNLAFLYLSLGLLISPALTFIKNIKLKLFLILSRKLLGILVFIIVIRHLIDYFQLYFPSGEGFLDYWNYFITQMFSPVIWSGTVGLVIFILLGLTSNKISVKIIGGKLWKILHLLVFPAYLLSMLHVFYLGRIDWFYGGITIVIIVMRILVYILKKKK